MKNKNKVTERILVDDLKDNNPINTEVYLNKVLNIDLPIINPVSTMYTRVSLEQLNNYTNKVWGFLND